MTTTAYDLYNSLVTSLCVDFSQSSNQQAYVGDAFEGEFGTNHVIAYSVTVAGSGCSTSINQFNSGSTPAYTVTVDGSAVTPTGWTNSSFGDVSVALTAGTHAIVWTRISGTTAYVKSTAANGALKVTSGTGSPTLAAHPTYSKWRKVRRSDTAMQISRGWFGRNNTHGAGDMVPDDDNMSNGAVAFTASGVATISIISRVGVALLVDGVKTQTDKTNNGTWTIRTFTGIDTASHKFMLVGIGAPYAYFTDIQLLDGGGNAVTPTSSGAKELMLFGDSFGSGLGTPGAPDAFNDWSWFFKLCATRGRLPTNGAVSSKTLMSNQPLADLVANSWDGTVGTPISDANLTIVLWLIINDKWTNTGSSSYTTNLTARLNAVRTKFPLSPIVVVNFPVAADFNTGAVVTPSVYNNAFTTGYNAFTDSNKSFLDASGWLAASGDLTGFHPTQQGSDAIYNNFLAVIPTDAPPVAVTSVVKSLVDGVYRWTFGQTLSAVTDISALLVHDVPNDVFINPVDWDFTPGTNYIDIAYEQTSNYNGAVEYVFNGASSITFANAGALATSGTGSITNPPAQVVSVVYIGIAAGSGDAIWRFTFDQPVLDPGDGTDMYITNSITEYGADQLVTPYTVGTYYIDAEFDVASKSNGPWTYTLAGGMSGVSFTSGYGRLNGQTDKTGPATVAGKSKSNKLFLPIILDLI